MSGLRAVLADDEPLVRSGLRRALAEVAPDVEVVGEARHGGEAIELVRALAPDLLFLDVQMPEVDGLAAARALAGRARPGIVFVTAYDQYAVAAFELHAIDYLLKPFDDDRLRTALARARQRLREEPAGAAAGRLEALLARLEAGPASPEHFLARVGSRMVLVPAARVRWFEAADNYVRLHTAEGVHVVRETLTRLEQRLDPRRFVRTHRSAIVQLAHVAEIQVQPSGDAVVRFTGGGEAPLGRRWREAFERRVAGE